MTTTSPSGAANRPTFVDIVTWLHDADPHNDTNVYYQLQIQAEEIGGQLQTNWEETVEDNGIAH